MAIRAYCAVLVTSQIIVTSFCIVISELAEVLGVLKDQRVSRLWPALYKLQGRMKPQGGFYELFG